MIFNYLKRFEGKESAKKVVKEVRHKFRLLFVDRRVFFPIIIFQPGKVGSLSVQYSLEQAFRQLEVSTPIYHSHALNYLDEREIFVKQTRKNPTDSLALIQEWKELLRKIKADSKQKWNIISLVRDPVAMKVSALFHLLYQHIPDWQERYENGNLLMSEIEELFYSKQEFGFRGLDQWYDHQVKALWGIDVFASPFPTNRGYQIYKSSRIRLLIIRLEDLNRVAQEAFKKFIGLKNITLMSSNIGEEKSYADLYKQFKSFPLPDRYVEDAYKTRYARHFYTKSEIEQFRQKWTKSSV